MKTILEVSIIILASVNLLMARFALFQLQQPTTVAMWLIKVFVSALSPVLFVVGVLAAIYGLIANSLPATAVGSCGALLYLLHIVKISGAASASSDFEKVFGKGWENRIPGETRASFLSRRYVIRLPHSPMVIFNQNISFYTIPGTTRQLLCDVWQPPKDKRTSGVGFIYLHGSAWTSLDKDYGTRTFFKHLASQGHVIMDVAYRLFPETDFMGMVHDANHAIAWLKANAGKYGVDPGKIVIGGGSAGAHIALLAAYTDQDPRFVPQDLRDVDLSVNAVISLYGQADLSATFYHTVQHLTTQSALAQQKKSSNGKPSWVSKRMGEDFHRLGFDKDVQPGRLVPILGGDPCEKPEAYALYSPITHVHEGCPPTLIIHGEQDILAPIRAISEMRSKLIAVGVPVVTNFVPQSDHAFDLILPKISPSAHNAYYDFDRFISLVASPRNVMRSDLKTSPPVIERA